MKVAISTGRPAHAAVPANLLRLRGLDVTLYTAAYRSRFRALDAEIHLRWLPQFVPMLHFVTGVQLPRALQRADTALYDHLVAHCMKPFDIFWGSATGSLASGRAARRLGAHFVLDRACPHVDAQQNLVQAECDRLGVAYKPEPTWFRDRQLAEYAEADSIVVPSHYTAASFAPEMQSRLIVAPLFGRVTGQADVHALRAARPEISPAHPFIFGMVGGSSVRKGFLYLLQAWEQLQLPQSRLLLRADAAELDKFPAIRERLRRLPNVEIVSYVKNMQDFYRRCDAFVFPTVDDGFGMALLEAIAHGLPAITTTHCGAAELFRAGEDLLVIPPQDAEALATAMEAIYCSAELRERLRSQALKALAGIESAGTYARYTQALDAVLERVQR